MNQGTIEKINVQTLLVALSGLSDTEKETLGRKLFSDIFLTDARRGKHSAHDGEEVIFFSNKFDHSFKCGNENEPNKLTERIERIKWILPIIQGKVSNSECWLINEDGREKRLYCSFSLGYVIWLIGREWEEGWNFKTAYPASPTHIRGYIKGGTKIAKF